MSIVTVNKCRDFHLFIGVDRLDCSGILYKLYVIENYVVIVPVS